MDFTEIPANQTISAFPSAQELLAASKEVGLGKSFCSGKTGETVVFFLVSRFSGGGERGL